MTLIGRRKKSKHPAFHGLTAVRLMVRALIAQRVARKVHKGYRWTRRLPWILGGGALIAFLARKAKGRSGPSEPPAPTPAGAPTPSAQPSEPVPPSVPTTPTPTGSPTAASPAPTAAEGAEKDGEPLNDGAPAAETPPADGDTEPKT